MESKSPPEKREQITVGEALEAAAGTIGDKPVDESDAAAIQAAEMIAVGASATPITGIGIRAQAVAMVNARRIHDEDKTTLAEVIGDVTNKLSCDKPVTRGDAEKVTAAELRGDMEGIIGAQALQEQPKESTTPGGVAETMAMAAVLNQP